VARTYTLAPHESNFPDSVSWSLLSSVPETPSPLTSGGFHTYRQRLQSAKVTNRRGREMRLHEKRYLPATPWSGRIGMLTRSAGCRP
jgi:hypothetical protein